MKPSLRQLVSKLQGFKIFKEKTTILKAIGESLGYAEQSLTRLNGAVLFEKRTEQKISAQRGSKETSSSVFLMKMGWNFHHV